jgi:predicted nucleotidyltransferase
MNHGLNEMDLGFIRDSISQFEEIHKAVLFGSRAKGAYKTGSDVDIAVFGQNVDFEVISKLHAILEDESPMPYFFDIIDYNHLGKKELQDHIDRVGEVIFVRGKEQ